MNDAGKPGAPAGGLAALKCTPCSGGVPALRAERLEKLRRQLPGWEVLDEKRLARSWKFPNFVKALEFVNRIGVLAEEQGHHPWIHFTWGRVKVEIWTHKIDGLTDSDFILAAKIDGLG